MAPPKAKGQKMGLGEFLTDTSLGSWADEMEDVPMPSGRPSYAFDRAHGPSNSNYASLPDRSQYSRESLPLPTKPPFTIHIGNMSFDATEGDVMDLFANCEVTNVRIVEDKLDKKPKGFAYAELATLEGLKKALDFNGTQFQGRNIRVSVAEPQKDRPDARELNDWTRKGPLPDIGPRRGTFEKQSSHGRTAELGNEGGQDRMGRRFGNEPSDGKARDFSNWERKGPLPPTQPPGALSARSTERPQSREGLKDRRNSPSWGEGRSQDGSRPPRREFAERPVQDRAPTAAEMDTQWRLKMRPDPAPATSVASPSSSGKEAPPNASPTLAGASPASQKSSTRPKLNLQKRTVSQHETPVPTTNAPDTKASPFGAARPIDTSAREKEIEHKIRLRKEQEEKIREEKRQPDEKSKEERRSLKDAEKTDRSKGNANGTAQQSELGLGTAKNYQILRRDANDDASSSGEKEENAEANGLHTPHDAAAAFPEADAPPKIHDAANGSSSPAPVDEEGWSTVSKSAKNRRGGNSGFRAPVA